MNKQVKWIMEELDSRPIVPEIDLAIRTCQHWSHMDHGYDSKNMRIQEWNPTFLDFYEIISHIFVAVLLKPEGITYQAMIGYISNNIRCEGALDRAKCAAEVIAICYRCNLIDITKISDKTMMITTEYSWDEEIPPEIRHMPYFKRPEELAHNSILGSRFKQHDLDTCQSHLNTLNSIPLCLETRVIDRLPEEPGKELEYQEQIDDWNKFRQASQDAYDETRQHDCFYLEHHYDTRGRTYCEGYYINYQGASYKKAIVQLANKEVVKL